METAHQVIDNSCTQYIPYGILRGGVYRGVLYVNAVHHKTNRTLPIIPLFYNTYYYP